MAAWNAMYDAERVPKNSSRAVAGEGGQALAHYSVSVEVTGHETLDMPIKFLVR
jgi:hypothetical protein